MSKIRQVVALIMLCMGLTHSFSWDIAVGARNRLEFYNNGVKSHVAYFGLSLDIEHVVYDIVHNRLLLVDGNLTRDHIIYSFNIRTKEFLPLVKRRLNETFHQFIYNLAYDPVTEKLFWTDMFAIYWFSLKPGFVNNDYGNVLFELDHSIANAIAVDSCKGYVYWSIVRGRGSSTIEKARLDGTEKEVVLDSNMSAIRHLVIDQQIQKMYWTDDVRKRSRGEKPQFSVNSADLNGENKRTLYFETEKNQPRALAVSNDSIYWVPSFGVSSKIWQLPKNPTEDAEPTAISVLGWSSNSIATNYNIEDQIQGIQDCEPLRSLIPNNTETNE